LGWVPPDRDTFVAKNRALEAQVAELGGRKWLYAHTYYTEDEFNGHRKKLRMKYWAGTPSAVYDKVKVKPMGDDDVGRILSGAASTRVLEHWTNWRTSRHA